MAADADRAAGAAPRAAAEGFPPHHRRPRREQRDAAPPHGRTSRASPSASRTSRRTSAGRPSRRPSAPTATPTPAAVGFARKYGVEVSELTRVDDAEGRVPLRRQARARPCGGGRPARRARRDAARPAVPEADAVGRLDRRRQGRVHVRPAQFAGCCSCSAAGWCRSSSAAARARNRAWCRTCAPARSRTGIAFLAMSGRPGRSVKVRSVSDYKQRLGEHFVLLEHSERHDRLVRELDAHARRLGGRVAIAAGVAARGRRSRRVSVGRRRRRSRRSSSPCPTRC